MDDRQYKDIDGNPIHLNTLCRREPEWAANQVRHRDKLKARLAAMEKHLDALLCESTGVKYHVVESGWLSHAREILKGE